MAKNQLVDKLKNVSAEDRKQIEQAQEMLGPDPETMGFIKNLFWGNFRQELVFPFPAESDEERARCDELLGRLDTYLRNEHPRIEIDQEQDIPGVGDPETVRPRCDGHDHPAQILWWRVQHHQLQPGS